MSCPPWNNDPFWSAAERLIYQPWHWVSTWQAHSGTASTSVCVCVCVYVWQLSASTMACQVYHPRLRKSAKGHYHGWPSLTCVWSGRCWLPDLAGWSLIVLESSRDGPALLRVNSCHLTFIDLVHHPGNYCFDEGFGGLLNPVMFCLHRHGVPDSVLSR